jgi:hypothetical protein
MIQAQFHNTLNLKEMWIASFCIDVTKCLRRWPSRAVSAKDPQTYPQDLWILPNVFMTLGSALALRARQG